DTRLIIEAGFRDRMQAGAEILIVSALPRELGGREIIQHLIQRDARAARVAFFMQAILRRAGRRERQRGKNKFLRELGKFCRHWHITPCESRDKENYYDHNWHTTLHKIDSFSAEISTDAIKLPN